MRTSRQRHRGFLRPLVRGLALGVLAIVACRPAADTDAPEAVPDAAHVEDVASLPAFDGGDPSRGDPLEPERYFVELGDAPTRGPDDAPITIVMFSDFECPFCLRGHQITHALERRYRGQIRLAYKAFPLDFHGSALLAAMAARSAQAQGRFWAFHDLLFSERGLDRDRVFASAEAAALDLTALARDLEVLEYGPEVRRDIRQGRKLGVSSTPTFFINGRMLTGAKPLDAFTEVIDDELTRSQSAIAAGVPRTELYANAIKDGYRRVEYSKRRSSLDPDGVYVVPIGDSPRRGPDDALVTIVAFEDFECPFCARGHATLTELAAFYPGKLRFVFKHSPLPFHSHAFVASRAAAAAALQDKFWAFHDALYETRAKFDEGDLTRIAKAIGLDMKAFQKAQDTTALDRVIERDLELGMTLGVTGTPAYFVNGRPLEGAMPLLEFRLVVEEELERARVALEHGTAATELYDVLSHQALE